MSAEEKGAGPQSLAMMSRRRWLTLAGFTGVGVALASIPGCEFVGRTDNLGSGLGRVMMGGPIVSLEFGCARSLYAEGMHPRLMISPGEVDSLRRACRGGACQVLLNRLREMVAPMVAEVLAAADESAPAATAPTTRGRGRSGPIAAGFVDEIAMVGVLDRDADTLEAARRLLVNGPDGAGSVLAFDLMHPRLSAADRRAFVARASARLQRYIDDAGPRFLLGAGANMRSTPMVAAVMLALVLIGEDGVPPLDDQLNELTRELEGSLYASLGPGGYPNEDMGYGTMMLGRLALAATCLRRAGRYDAYTQCPRLARSGTAILHFVQPWGQFLTNTGDHSDEFTGREAPLAHLARLNRDATLSWLLGTLRHPMLDDDIRKQRAATSNEVELAPGFFLPMSAMSLINLPDLPPPVHPDRANVPTAFVDRGRGIVTFRSGWAENDTYVCFDGSQRPSAAQGHAHDSGGHFALSAAGEYFAVGPGRYGIDQDQHNLMLIDGKSGRSTNGNWGQSNYQARLIDYRPDPLCDYASVGNNEQTNGFWSFRHLGLVKGPRTAAGTQGYVWTVDDINADNGAHVFWWTLHSHPANTIELTGQRAVIRGNRRGNHLHVGFAMPNTRSYPDPFKLELAQDVPGPGSYNYVGPKEMENNRHRTVHHAVYFRPRLIARLSGWAGQLMAVMAPQMDGAAVPQIEALPTLDGALAIRVGFAEIEDTIIFAFAHSLLEANGVRARGHWAVVRRAHRRPEGVGRVLGYTVADGDRLEVDGKVFPV